MQEEDLDTDAIGIEIRLYSDPGTSNPNLTNFFVDNLRITVDSTSPTAAVRFANGTVISAVPEPTTLALLGIFGLGAALMRRKNRK